MCGCGSAAIRSRATSGRLDASNARNIFSGLLVKRLVASFWSLVWFVVDALMVDQYSINIKARTVIRSATTMLQ